MCPHFHVTGAGSSCQHIFEAKLIANSSKLRGMELPCRWSLVETRFFGVEAVMALIYCGFRCGNVLNSL